MEVLDGSGRLLSSTDRLFSTSRLVSPSVALLLSCYFLILSILLGLASQRRSFLGGP